VASDAALRYNSVMKTRVCLLLCTFLISAFTMADVVECENGDRYNGKVLLLNEKELRLTNDIQGIITIPRQKILSISLRMGTPAKRAVGDVQNSLTNGGIQLDPSSVAKVQQQFLSDANPEANELFQQMVQGLMTGKMDVNDVRNKAQGTLEQLRQFQKELGQDEEGELLGSYVNILEAFLKNASQRTNTTSVPDILKEPLPPPNEPKR
jgi:hypothetical protein